jgi:hypothetical protein
MGDVNGSIVGSLCCRSVVADFWYRHRRDISQNRGAVMSATICYRPVLTKRYYVPTMAPSSFMEALGELPRTFGAEDLPILRVCARVGHREAFEHLIDAIEKYGAIELWAEY